MARWPKKGRANSQNLELYSSGFSQKSLKSEILLLQQPARKKIVKKQVQYLMN